MGFKKEVRQALAALKADIDAMKESIAEHDDRVETNEEQTEAIETQLNQLTELYIKKSIIKPGISFFESCDDGEEYGNYYFAYVKKVISADETNVVYDMHQLERITGSEFSSSEGKLMYSVVECTEPLSQFIEDTYKSNSAKEVTGKLAAALIRHISKRDKAAIDKEEAKIVATEEKKETEEN